MSGMSVSIGVSPSLSVAVCPSVFCFPLSLRLNLAGLRGETVFLIVVLFLLPFGRPLRGMTAGKAVATTVSRSTCCKMRSKVSSSSMCGHSALAAVALRSPLRLPCTWSLVQR